MTDNQQIGPAIAPWLNQTSAGIPADLSMTCSGNRPNSSIGYRLVTFSLLKVAAVSIQYRLVMGNSRLSREQLNVDDL